MFVKMRLKPEKAEEIRSAIFNYLKKCREEDKSGGAYYYLVNYVFVRGQLGRYDGEATYFLRVDKVEYLTSSRLGFYHLECDNTLCFSGSPYSFRDGTGLFLPIQKEDCLSYEVLEL